jgi:hypothetical protein
LARIDLARLQQETCAKFGADCDPVQDGLKVGIAANVRGTDLRINGLRHRPEGDTTGWYIWAGDVLSEAEDFFMPLHVAHMEEWCPEVLKYHALPPGWRFSAARDHEDVWFDASLLDI